MKRSGFTMIELIFVIVILGILAAVALPKFIGVSEEAQVSKLKSYVGTLNRTVAPALWSKSISTGKGGHVTDGTFDTDLNASLPALQSLDDNGNSFSIGTLNGKCTTSAATLASTAIGSAMADGDINATISIGGKNYTVGCADGNMTNSPQFFLTGSGNLLVK